MHSTRPIDELAGNFRHLSAIEFRRILFASLYNSQIMVSRLFKKAMNSLPIAFLLAVWLYSMALFLWIGLGMFSHFPGATDANILLLFPILFAGTWVAMFVLEIIEPNGRRKERSKGFEVLPPK